MRLTIEYNRVEGDSLDLRETKAVITKLLEDADFKVHKINYKGRSPKFKPTYFDQRDSEGLIYIQMDSDNARGDHWKKIKTIFATHPEFRVMQLDLRAVTKTSEYATKRMEFLSKFKRSGYMLAVDNIPLSARDEMQPYSSNNKLTMYQPAPSSTKDNTGSSRFDALVFDTEDDLALMIKPIS